jgi:aspartate aminotransferase-like enzyme
MTDLFQYKIADQLWEFEQIKKLNYATFVEEIPQHSQSSERSLTDKFHNENIYFICVSEKNLFGMVAIRNKRPFSIDQKLENIDAYLPAAKSICEVRLLSVKKEFRRSRISFNLLIGTAKFCEEQGYDLAVISAVLNQRKLYQHMGFKPFGPLVGTPKVSFQPMYLTLKDYQKNVKPLLKIENQKTEILNFLPGPVEIAADVKAAFEHTISHRSPEFKEIYAKTKQQLCNLAEARNVEIFMGSGTLANDVVAGQLSLLAGKGLILSNGEFGERLIAQAQRFGLDFETLSRPWAAEFDYEKIKSFLSERKIKWLWAVHCETSTGMLNDLLTLKNICKQFDVKLCLDCISSLASAYVNLEDVWLASAVSGKAIGSFSGLAMVFYDHRLAASSKNLPVYLDLEFYAQKENVPFTISSNLICGLNAALSNISLNEKLKKISVISNLLKNELRKLGLHIIIPDSLANPSVITIQMPENINSEAVGIGLNDRGIWISYNSEYLLERNWIQICLMGQCREKSIQVLIDELKKNLCHKINYGFSRSLESG